MATTTDAAVRAASAIFIPASHGMGFQQKSRPFLVSVIRSDELEMAAVVTIDGSTTKQAVQAAFEQAVRAYLAGLAREAFARNLDGELDDVDGGTYTVSYNRVSAILLTIPGVVDHEALTVGGGTANLTMASDQTPVLTGVTVT